jgi:hypothetical protein
MNLAAVLGPLGFVRSKQMDDRGGDRARSSGRWVNESHAWQSAPSDPSMKLADTAPDGDWRGKFRHARPPLW